MVVGTEGSEVTAAVSPFRPPPYVKLGQSPAHLLGSTFNTRSPDRRQQARLLGEVVHVAIFGYQR